MQTRPRVLFVGNDQSSPEIAANLLRRLVGDRVEIVTAGAQVPEHGGRADDILVQMGLNPAAEERLSVRALNVADRVVVLGTGLDVARVAGRRYEEWDVENEDLEQRVRRLSIELLTPTGPERELGSSRRLPALVEQVRDWWTGTRLGRTLGPAARRAVAEAQRRLRRLR